MFGCLFRYLGRRILGQEDQGEEQDEEAILSLEIFNFSLNLEAVYKML